MSCVAKAKTQKDESLSRLNDQLIVAKEKGDTKTMNQIQKVIDAIKAKE